MTPLELHDLSALTEYPRSAAELVRVAGLDAAAKLITAWPGQAFPVPIYTGRANARGARRFEMLAEIVGDQAARKIINHWPGHTLNIPNLKEARWARKQDTIRARYDTLTTQDGYSHNEAVFELGILHEITGRCVELVLKRPDNPVAEERQGKLF